MGLETWQSRETGDGYDGGGLALKENTRFTAKMKMDVFRSVGGGAAWWGRVWTRRGCPPQFLRRVAYHGGVC